MTEGIHKLGVAVPPEHFHWRHHALGALRDGFVVDGIHVFHIDHHALRRRRVSRLWGDHSHLWVFVSEHHHVVADFDLRVSDFGALGTIHAHHFGGAEHFFVEVDCFGCITHDHAWDQCVIAVGYGFGAHRHKLNTAKQNPSIARRTHSDEMGARALRAFTPLRCRIGEPAGSVTYPAPTAPYPTIRRDKSETGGNCRL